MIKQYHSGFRNDQAMPPCVLQTSFIHSTYIPAALAEVSDATLKNIPPPDFHTLHLPPALIYESLLQI